MRVITQTPFLACDTIGPTILLVSVAVANYSSAVANYVLPVDIKKTMLPLHLCVKVAVCINSCTANQSDSYLALAVMGFNQHLVNSSGKNLYVAYVYLYVKVCRFKIQHVAS